MINKIKTITLLLICVSISISSQDWYKAPIGLSDMDGYHSIDLPNEVVALSKRQDLLDLRIVDKNGKEIPFFVKQKMQQHEASNFHPFDLLENTTVNGGNKILIDNSLKKQISQMLIASIAADVNCSIDVRGSNNKTDWYIVKQKQAISASHRYSIGDRKSVDDIFDVRIPSGDYEYYQVNISNNQKTPLNILGVYWLERENRIAQLSEVNIGKINVADSLKYSVVSFPNTKYNYKVSKLKIYTSNKENFKRSGKLQYSDNYSVPFQISSNKDNVNDIDLNKDIILSDDFKIIINNGDNLPLNIDSVKFFARQMELCAFLSKDANYTLTIGEKDNIPNYDIANFENELDDLSQIKVGNIEKVDRPLPVVAPRDKMWIENPIVMWSIIIIVGFALLFICGKMIKDMGKKEE